MHNTASSTEETHIPSGQTAISEQDGTPNSTSNATEKQAIEGLSTIVDYLASVPAWYLATCEGDQPHVRPFSFAAQQGERIWFCTATTKDVYRELQANPKLELTAWKPGCGWIILRGEADLHDEASPAMRHAGFEHMCALGEYHESENDPALTFFSVAAPQAWLCDIDGTWAPIPLP